MCVACTTALFSSCLDTVILPDDITVGEDFWKKKSDVAKMVNAAYEGMTTDAVTERLIIWGDARSDEMVRAASPEGSTPEALAEILAFSAQVTNQFATWSDFYSVINKCNIVLERAGGVLEEDPNYTEGDYQTDRSQMLALRSLCYFYLVRNFRDIPYIEQSFMDSSQERDFTQASPLYVLQRCIENLQEAAANAIQSRSYNDWRRVGWFTQDGIHALLADIYLWRASMLHSASDYQQAVYYCNLVIESKKAQHRKGWNEIVPKEYPLVDADKAYEEVFATQNGEESIFEIQNRANTALCKYLFKHGSTSSTEGFLKASTIFAQNTSVTTAAQAINEKVYHTNDIRFYSSIFKPTSTVEVESYDVRKMISELPQSNLTQQTRNMITRDYGALDQNYIVYRLSDVMLMKAEAMVQLVDESWDATTQDNKLREAFNLVQAVNNRSLLTANLGDSLKWSGLNTARKGKGGMELLVLEERLRELCFEGKRWYDLIRYNYRHVSGINFDESLGAQGLEALQPNFNDMLDIIIRGQGSQSAGLKAKVRNEAYLYLPIPNSDIILCPNMKQNPAYGSNNQFEKK
jgi:hypothetical protein